MPSLRRDGCSNGDAGTACMRTCAQWHCGAFLKWISPLSHEERAHRRAVPATGHEATRPNRAAIGLLQERLGDTSPASG